MSSRAKRILSVILLTAFAFSLTSCKSKSPSGGASNGALTLSLPLKEQNVPPAPYGDSRDSEVLRASIYYASSDGTVSVPSTRVLGLNSRSSVERRLAEELMKTPGGDAVAVVPKGSRIASVEVSGGIVTVDVIPSSPMSGAEIKTLSEAMSKTMFTLDGVTGVNLLISGRAAAFHGLPIGLITPYADLSALYDEAVHYPESETVSVSRRAVGYFPSADESCVIPFEISLSLHPSDPAQAVLHALGVQPDSPGLLAGVPACESMFEKASRYTTAPSGDRILNIHLTNDAYTALKASGHDRHMYLASIVMTLTSLLPDTDGVLISIGGRTITEVPLKNGTTRTFSSGIMKRADFAPYIGTNVPVYFANQNNMLSPEIRAVNILNADSARARIQALMEGPADASLLPVFPDGVKPSDILGVNISGSVARVNLSANVYRLMQSFTENEEELFVYSLVNTLSDLRGVSGVRLYFEGVTGSVLTHKVYLEGVLLKNPGRIQTSDISASN